MKNNIFRRNILKLLAAFATTLGINSLLGRNASGTLNKATDATDATLKPIAPNPGMSSSSEIIIANGNLKDVRLELTSIMQKAVENPEFEALLKKYDLFDATTIKFLINKEKIQTKKNIKIDDEIMSSLIVPNSGMNSSSETIIANGKLKDVQLEVASRMEKALKNSELETVLEKYDLLDAIKIEVLINKEKLQTQENIEIDEETMSSFKDTTGEDFIISGCLYCPALTCCNNVPNPCAGCP